MPEPDPSLRDALCCLPPRKRQPWSERSNGQPRTAFRRSLLAARVESEVSREGVVRGRPLAAPASPDERPKHDPKPSSGVRRARLRAATSGVDARAAVTLPPPLERDQPAVWIRVGASKALPRRPSRCLKVDVRRTRYRRWRCFILSSARGSPGAPGNQPSAAERRRCSRV